MLDPGGVGRASERLHRTSGAHNTTQAESAVWCRTASGGEPLGERRQGGSVVEEVFFADGDSILREEGPVLVGKADCEVMFLLPGYIAGYHLAVAHIVCKTGILFCPAIKGREMGIGFQPFACGYFEVLHKFGHRKGGRKRDKDVYVVGHPSDAEKVSSCIVDEAENVGVEFSLVLGTDGVTAAVGAQNDMVKGLCITHTWVTMGEGRYFVTRALSPVSDRLVEGCCVHRTAPSACTVLCAPWGACSVSDTAIQDMSHIHPEHATCSLGACHSLGACLLLA